MKNYLEKLINRENLSTEEMKDAVHYCFTETATDSEIAAFLTALQAKGETADEITGIVDVIRNESSFQATAVSGAMDNCGTGGDKSYSFNISTTSAFVLAGAGVTVAKHGNRSITSKSGSADVLEKLGVSLSFSKEQTEELLQENQIAFLYAPNVHVALKPFTKVRRELRIATIFNAIGPLTNPITLESQLLGVYRRELMPILTEALHKLGRKRAVVVNGAGNVDEATLSGENQLMLLDNGKITSFTLRPEDVGLPYYSKDEIRGGDANRNADILLNVLKGKSGAYYNTTILNAGIGIFANGKAETIEDGIELARESIDSGAALAKLEFLMNYSKKIPSEVF
ncbi:anthranilate phosphoribosyltransferase [Oceanobacillus chungangensis]|uniref:Anthranilate phosphoribosyltransferase n=1 Tax=Oceanobacillus chungangensis TaxID=1229152 RepID=A0A3D8PYV6_9BACI|nr:anthranilate phosphoribosyltransferase [Oceanobacillus chungangensis]RDW21204.1 anthranilate phosphoribosyltransferase [Oceanobacillus chungangensis]